MSAMIAVMLVQIVLLPGEEPAVETLPEHVAIVQASDAEGFVPGCSMGGGPERPDAYWTPGARQVEAIERRLPAQIAMLNARKDLPIELSLSGYGRQYAGAVYGGRSVYYIFFFPLAGDGDVGSEPVRVCDGGPRYWAILFDAASMAFSEPVFSSSYPGRGPVEKPPLPSIDSNDI